MHESEFLIICDMQRSSESTEPLERSRSVDLCKWNFEMVLEVSESNRNCFRNFSKIVIGWLPWPMREAHFKSNLGENDPTGV